MVTATLAMELRREQTAIAARVTDEYLSTFGALNFKAIDLSSPGFIEASVSIAERGHRESGVLGSDMYLSMRRDAGVSGSVELATPELDKAQLRRDLIILGPVAAKRLMSQGIRIPEAAQRVFTLTAGRVAKTAISGTRDTISATTRLDDQAFAYARQTAAGACDFCVMLAGNTYKSAETAMFSSGMRKRNKAAQPAGEKFHDHCRCTLITLFRSQMPERRRLSRRQFSEAWVEASRQGMRYTDFLDRNGLTVGY